MEVRRLQNFTLTAMTPLSAMSWVWITWAVSWAVAAAWANRTEARPTVSAELLYRVVTMAGIGLLFVAARMAHPGPRFWHTPPPVGWCLVALTFAGFAFCWWARIHLGRLWSSSVTRKSDHRIIDTGPYSLVRHPIYTGIITAALAMAANQATLGALIGLALVIVGFWIKARLEERFLRQELGAEVYDAYTRRTGMLVPRL